MKKGLSYTESENLLNKCEESLRIIGELRYMLQAAHKSNHFSSGIIGRSRDHIADMQDIIVHHKKQLKIELNLQDIYGGVRK